MSLKELELINPQNIKFFSDEIMTFDTNNSDLLQILGGIIKRGIILDNSKQGSLENLLEQELETSGKRLLGINNLKLGKDLKKSLGFKRFKLTKPGSTDRDIKNKGIEIITLGGKFGLVKGYQNITLYEEIDFEKPSRSMQMGMMPAKLTHIMLNIGIFMLQDSPFTKGGKGVFNGSLQETIQPTLVNNALIYDPFAGSGTTGFLANHFGYDFVGSDIDIFHLHRNMPRRREHKLSSKAHTYFFEQDITKDIDIRTLKRSNPKQMLIVTEGRLGPLVKNDTSIEQIKDYQEEVIELYKHFLQTISVIKKQLPTKAIFTIPYYLNPTKNINTIEKTLKSFGSKLGLKINSIDEIYKREKQKIGRKILIID